MLKIGMIGAGIHATGNLYPSLKYLEGVQLVAVCDINEQKARDAARNFGFEKHYVDYKKMLQQESLDGAIVCLNAELHPGISIDCVQAGVNLLVEKPPARTLEQAKQMSQASRDSGKFIMVGFQKRFGTPYVKAMEIVRSDEFGKVVLIEAKMHGFEYPTIFTSLMEWQIHILDLVRAFGGEVVEIRATANRLNETRASILTNLKFENGVIATLSLGTEGGSGRFCERIEIVSDRKKGSDC